MTISLPPDLEDALEERARKEGTTPETLVLESLRARFVTAPPPSERGDRGESLATFLAGHIGVLHSSERVAGGARMSEQTGRQFGEGMEAKRREGRL